MAHSAGRWDPLPTAPCVLREARLAHSGVGVGSQRPLATVTSEGCAGCALVPSDTGWRRAVSSSGVIRFGGRWHPVGGTFAAVVCEPGSEQAPRRPRDAWAGAGQGAWLPRGGGRGPSLQPERPPVSPRVPAPGQGGRPARAAPPAAPRVYVQREARRGGGLAKGALPVGTRSSPMTWSRISYCSLPLPYRLRPSRAPPLPA